MPDLANCVVTGTLYEQDGTPMPEGKATLTVLSIVKAGEFVEPSPGTARTKRNDVSGVITLTLPRLSNVTLQSKATAGKEVIDQFANAVTVSIPDSATANLEDLIAAAQVPTEGVVVQDDGVGFPNKVGTFNFGQGLVATETSAGVSEVKLPYKVYRAFLQQGAATAPIATVLENTLGGTVIWTRASAGTYDMTLVGAFPEDKIMIFMGTECFIITAFSIIKAEVWLPGDANRITTRDYDPVLGYSVLKDDILANTAIEVYVYP